MLDGPVVRLLDPRGLLAVFGLLSLGAWATASRVQAQADAQVAHAVELAWRWGISPVAEGGPRVLDQVDLALRLRVRGRAVLVPHVGVGVSYGSRWVMLGSVGLEAGGVFERDDAFLYVCGGLLTLGEQSGGGPLRNTLADDLGLVARVGWLRRLSRIEVGAEVRVLAALLGSTNVAGPLDLGLAGRIAVPFGR